MDADADSDDQVFGFYLRGSIIVDNDGIIDGIVICWLVAFVASAFVVSNVASADDALPSISIE